MQVSENKMLRKISGSKRDAVRGHLWILHRKKLNNDSCRSRSIVRFTDWFFDYLAIILTGWAMQHQMVR
jgi:hypothetical protein